MTYWSGDYLNTGKCVCGDVVLAGNMADVCGELRDKVQVVELAR